MHAHVLVFSHSCHPGALFGTILTWGPANWWGRSWSRGRVRTPHQLQQPFLWAVPGPWHWDGLQSGHCSWEPQAGSPSFQETLYPAQGFPNLGITDILAWVFSCWGACPVHYRLFGSIPGLHLLDASSTQQLQPPKVSWDMVTCPWGAKSHSWEQLPYSVGFSRASPWIQIPPFLSLWSSLQVSKSWYRLRPCNAKSLFYCFPPTTIGFSSWKEGLRPWKPQRACLFFVEAGAGSILNVNSLSFPHHHYIPTRVAGWGLGPGLSEPMFLSTLLSCLVGLTAPPWWCGEGWWEAWAWCIH